MVVWGSASGHLRRRQVTSPLQGTHTIHSHTQTWVQFRVSIAKNACFWSVGGSQWKPTQTNSRQKELQCDQELNPSPSFCEVIGLTYHQSCQANNCTWASKFKTSSYLVTLGFSFLSVHRFLVIYYSVDQTDMQRPNTRLSVNRLDTTLLCSGHVGGFSVCCHQTRSNVGSE